MSKNIVKSVLQRCVNYCKGQQKVTAKYQQKMTQESSDTFLQIGDFKVFSWSISGIETSVVVRKPADGFDCCFDMGYSCRENVKSQSVLIR